MKEALLYAVYWAIAGAVVGLGIQSYFGVEAVIIPCGALNVIFGLSMLLFVIRNPQAYKAFYGEAEGGGLALAVLITIPLMQLVAGFIWWLMGIVFAF